MNKSVLFIFVAFIVISSFVRFLSVDHFDTDNVSIVANSILSSTLDDRYQCLVNYDEELRTSIQNCDIEHGSVPSNALRECKVEAHMTSSKDLSDCLLIMGVDVPEPIVETTTAPIVETTTAPIIESTIKSSTPVNVIEPASKIAVVPEPPCDEASCYKIMSQYKSKGWAFNNVNDFPDCRNCPEKDFYSFTPIVGVTDQYTPENTNVDYPGNYCRWGLANDWCNISEFSNGPCINECTNPP